MTCHQDNKVEAIQGQETLHSYSTEDTSSEAEVEAEEPSGTEPQGLDEDSLTHPIDDGDLFNVYTHN